MNISSSHHLFWFFSPLYCVYVFVDCPSLGGECSSHLICLDCIVFCECVLSTNKQVFIQIRSVVCLATANGVWFCESESVCPMPKEEDSKDAEDSKDSKHSKDLKDTKSGDQSTSDSGSGGKSSKSDFFSFAFDVNWEGSNKRPRRVKCGFQTSSGTKWWLFSINFGRGAYTTRVFHKKELGTKLCLPIPPTLSLLERASPLWDSKFSELSDDIKPQPFITPELDLERFATKYGLQSVHMRMQKETDDFPNFL